MEDNFTDTEVLTIETTHETKYWLQRMAKDMGLKTAEQMATNILSIAAANHKRLNKKIPR